MNDIKPLNAETPRRREKTEEKLCATLRLCVSALRGVEFKLSRQGVDHLE
jgi:hypothetical protein